LNTLARFLHTQQVTRVKITKTNLILKSFRCFQTFGDAHARENTLSKNLETPMQAKTPFPKVWKRPCMRKYRFQKFGNAHARENIVSKNLETSMHSENIVSKNLETSMHTKTPFPNFWKHSCTRKHRFQTFGNIHARENTVSKLLETQ
jgi:hypothetical protein